jgi:hypothetical protein
MGLDIFFDEDIRNALLAANEASASTARVCAALGGDQVALRAYLEGYRAALTTVALAFGLSPAIITCRDPSIPQQAQDAAGSGQGETLEVEACTVSESLPISTQKEKG